MASAKYSRFASGSVAMAGLERKFLVFFNCLVYITADMVCQSPVKHFEYGLLNSLRKMMHLSVRAFRPAPTSSSLSYQSGEQWTHPLCNRARSSNRPQPLTNLHALSKKRLFYAFVLVNLMSLYRLIFLCLS